MIRPLPEHLLLAAIPVCSTGDDLVRQHQAARNCCTAIACYSANLMAGENDSLDDEADVVTQTRSERKLQKPKMYKVLLHNDDYTTMEFVVFVLMSIFHRPEPEAVQIMMHVHRNGVGVAGVYTFEVAETRVRNVEALARRYEYPLRCTFEEA